MEHDKKLNIMPSEKAHSLSLVVDQQAESNERSEQNREELKKIKESFALNRFPYPL